MDILNSIMDIHKWAVMDIHNCPFMDIHNCIMDIINSIMDIFNSIMDIINSIMDIHNCGVLALLYGKPKALKTPQLWISIINYGYP